MITVREADWTTEEQALIAVREEVFVVEQNVPVEIEIDGEDPSCRHVAALDGERFIGTARLMPDGRIGRVAVLKEYRRKGVGSQLINALLEMARSSGCTESYLHGQMDSIAFYEQLGFVAEGGIFYEADIPHRTMRKPLA